MREGDLVKISDLWVYAGYIDKIDGRVLRFQRAGGERLICEEWWLNNGGESVEEVLETSDAKDAGE